MSGWANPTQPNLSDYALFLQNQGFDTTVLPSDSQWIEYAFNQALVLVNPYGQYAQFCDVSGVTNVAYTLAVYNCATHIQVRITPDQTGQTFFQGLRTQFNILGFVGGTVQASSDESTSQTLLAPEFLKNLTLRDLNFILTPWGREYLSYAQDYGEIVGVS